MPLSKTEVLALVDEIDVAISELVLNFAQLTEGMIDDAATDGAKEKLERLRQDTQSAKQKLSDLKDRQRHKKEIERQRKEHERERNKHATNEGKSSSGTLTLRDGAGKVVGFIRFQKHRTDYFNRTGKLVAFEISHKTFGDGAKFLGAGNQGLRVLGMSQSN